MNNHHRRDVAGRRRRRALLAAGVSLVALPALAQPAAPPAAAPSDGAVAEVVVTASRVARSGFTAPTPTQIVGADQIDKRGATNIATVLDELPAFKATTTAATNGVRSIFPGSNYADLRGLGAVRTLVLVDGKRFVPQVTTGLSSAQVDLNQVPAILLDRSEVVTGGASAQWGSDAVAGVVNLVLKKDFEGLQAEVQGGKAQAGDDQEGRIGVLAGTAFMGGKAHIEAAVDYDRNNGVGDAYTRDWGRKGYGIIVNPCPLAAAVSAACPTGGNGQAQNLILPNIRYSTDTAGGLINNAPGTPVALAGLRGTQFLPGGAPASFAYGSYVGTQFMQGGDAVNAGQNIYTGVPLGAASIRLDTYARLSYHVTEDITAYAEGSYSEATGSSQTLPPRNEQSNPITIRLDNAYLPSSILARVQAYNVGLPTAQQITSLSLGRFSEDIGRPRSNVKTDTGRFVIGVNGVFSSWKWDAAYIYGKNHYVQQVADDRILANFAFAADAVLSPAGAVVCRATLPGAAFNAAAAGCVPLNPFGAGSVTAAARNYVTGTLMTHTDYDQNAFNANVNGEPFSTWAGPVSIASGFEYRRESQQTVVDPIAEVAGYESTNARSLNGSFDVKEGYVETVVPLAHDMAFAKSLEFNGAVRETDYSSSGAVTTWKVGGTWTPVTGLLFRAARSRDIRAPAIFELDTLPVSTTTNVALTNGVGGGPSGNVSVQQLQGGNPKLQPEVAETTTYGVSYQPAFAPGLQMSVDFYDINLSGAIASVTAAQVTTFCNAGNAYYCGLIVLRPAGSATPYAVNANYQNLNLTRRTGLDLLGSYRTRLDRFFAAAPGAVTVSFAGNYVIHYGDNIANAGYIERAGETVSTPRFNATTSFTYDIGPASVTAQWRHIGSGVYNATYAQGVQINDNTVDGRDYLNLSGSYQFGKIQIFGVINNVFDTAPPIAPQNFGYPTINTWFDMIGRAFRLGARYRF